MTWRTRGALGIALAMASGCSSDETARGTPANRKDGAPEDGGASSMGGRQNAGGVANGSGGASAAGGVPANGGASDGGSPSTGGNPTSTGGAPSDGGACSPSIQTSCLGQFFDEANQCFHPSGTCVVQSAANGKHVCWSNGAKLVFSDGPTGGGFNYFQGGLCFYGSWSAQAGVTTSYTFTLNGGDLLVYDPRDGKTTCLDGSMTTVAPDFGGCGAITSLLRVDDTGCSPGTCN